MERMVVRMSKSKIIVPEKTNSISQVRYICALGASHTASAIPRVIPITHCGPGCADKQYVNVAFYNGFQGGGYGAGAVVPSTNFSEKEVVFGGVERLRELIESSVKILDADLFVVLTGCIPDIVGDDISSVVGEFQRKGVPIVAAETGGFKGNNFLGHETVIKSIIDQYVGDYSGKRKNGVVNLFSLVPFQNSFWRGDITELKRILTGIGLKVNVLFGPESGGVKEWKQIPEAQFNLVISPWLGVDIARHLEEKYGQPFLHIPVLPIGAQETGNFLRKVGEFAGIPGSKIEKFIKKEEKLYYYYLEGFSDFYAEYWWGVPSTYSVAADSAYALALNKFLVNQLGLIPSKQFITDNPPEEFREGILDEYKKLAKDVSVVPEFIEDSYIIHQKLRTAEYGQRAPIIFGSSWERNIAKELKGHIVEIAFPTSYEVVINRSYLGYRGALTLLEKIFTEAVSASA